MLDIYFQLEWFLRATPLKVHRMTTSERVSENGRAKRRWRVMALPCKWRFFFSSFISFSVQSMTLQRPNVYTHWILPKCCSFIVWAAVSFSFLTFSFIFCLVGLASCCHFDQSAIPVDKGLRRPSQASNGPTTLWNQTIPNEISEEIKRTRNSQTKKFTVD